MSVIVIGASTGGPPALATILAALPADLQAAVVVVQHMAEGFVEGLARWLDGLRAPGLVARDGDRLRPGHVVLAPATGTSSCSPGSGSSRPRHSGSSTCPGSTAPSGRSPRSAATARVGVLLTGMGRDGAEGLLAMRRAGAFTIGQDERTSVVWGMPAAARARAPSVELPLPEIAAGRSTPPPGCVPEAAEMTAVAPSRELTDASTPPSRSSSPARPAWCST